MKRHVRQHLAAAWLLLPAAALLASPAIAQQRAVVAAPEIAAVSVAADDGLLPGSTLQFTMRATPNADDANITLGGGIVVTVRQTAPGVYQGNYVVRRADRIDPAAALVARARYGERHIARNVGAPAAFQARSPGGPPGLARAPGLDRDRDGNRDRGYGRDGDRERGDERNADRGRGRDNDRDDDRRGRVARDDRPPQIDNLSPANGARVGERGRVNVAASLRDEGSGIDPASVQLRIDGRDVTRNARLNGDQLLFREELPPGRHTVEVTVRDHARNSTTKSWNFEVLGNRDADRPRERPAAVAPVAPLTMQLFGVANNGIVDANGELLLQGQTAPNAKVRVQVNAVRAGGAPQLIMDHMVDADAVGRFNVTLGTRMLPLAGTRYDVRFIATDGVQSTEQRMSVSPRQG
jgi:hypothetical protein